MSRYDIDFRSTPTRDQDCIAIFGLREFDVSTPNENFLIRSIANSDSDFHISVSAFLHDIGLHEIRIEEPTLIQMHEDFRMLKERWKSDTAHLSSIIEICMHPAYQQIIGKGKIIIPLILSDMENEPNHWFWALKSITGEDPVSPEQVGRIRQMTGAWLRWGKEYGYLNEQPTD